MVKLKEAFLSAFHDLETNEGSLFKYSDDLKKDINAGGQIQRKLHEVCLNHKLANYIEKYVLPLIATENMFVDIEFNRDGGNFKELNYNGDEKKVRPDIIIHNRESGNQKKNFLVVECKKQVVGNKQNQDKIALDTQRLESFLKDEKYLYRFGLSVLYKDDGIQADLCWLNHDRNVVYTKLR